MSRHGYDFLFDKLRGFMRDPPKDDMWFGTGGVPEGDILVHCHVDGGDNVLDGKLVVDFPRPGFGVESKPLFSFRRSGGGWSLERDEKLVSYWLWKRLDSVMEELA